MNEALRKDIDWLEANRNPDAAIINTDREPPTL